ncbi:hypothetical protein [Allorhizocola rhizosphaerae]|uniref:hypothetical protein n=1 Tax=Allorhizocola rhizosphaerae TaxID=1872709 RepID=UPI0013C370FC|nr:hypothetical protein [Allorhizocola rhizosphaerae]
MTIPQPNLDTKNQLDFVVQVPPPNDNTDGRDCICGHAKADHEPLRQPDSGDATWQCLYCACTQAYPAKPVPSHP